MAQGGSSDALEVEYHANQAGYEALRDEVKFALDAAMEVAGIRTHDISARVKGLASLRDKAARKAWANPLTEASDIVGARVVVLFRTDVPRATQIVRNQFQVLKEDDKLSEAHASMFGYSGVHVDARLGDIHAGPRYDAIKGYQFEVQVRTIVEDAWAAVSHVLEYKGRSSIPEHLQRDFYALSGLFYIADQHFEMFFNEAERAGQDATAAVQAQEAAPKGGRVRPLPLNADTLSAYVNRVYPDREPASRAAASELVPALKDAGFDTIPRVKSLLDRARDAVGRLEEGHPPGTYDHPGRFAAIGIARMSLVLGDKTYREQLFGETAWLEPYTLD